MSSYSAQDSNLSLQQGNDHPPGRSYWEETLNGEPAPDVVGMELDNRPAPSPLEQLRSEYAVAAAAAKEGRMSYMLLGETGVQDRLEQWHLERALHQAGLPITSSQMPVLRAPDLGPPMRMHAETSDPKHSKNPRGIMASLPAELRAMVNAQLCDRFWQCYQHDHGQLKLLGTSHSSPVPALLRTSSTVRHDFLYSAASAYTSKSATIVIGTNIIAFNFPLTTGLAPCGGLDDNIARLPQARELFIGIQIPSPRRFEHMVQVRINVRRIVALLNSIATRSPLPPIRVSFETNARNAGLRFYSNDWYTLIGPLMDLHLQQPASNLKSRKPVLIDRCQRFGILDTERDTVCRIIEDTIQQTPNDKITAFHYTQCMMDVKLCLLFCADYGPEERLIKRLVEFTTALHQWYDQQGLAGAKWLTSLKDAVNASSLSPVSHDLLKEIAKHVARETHNIKEWTNGHQRSRNPFWKDNEECYWL